MLPERQFHANGRAAVASRERPMPGTPSRKEKHRESSALQDPGLKDYVRTLSKLPRQKLFVGREEEARV
ncbi:Protein kinase of the Mitotic Exit Network [Fusarium falciforme]|nr:Protein kinase of the Mitotic Exit Network [Fusarium falciforme]